MKITILALSGILATGLSWAGSLQKDQVSADVKWLLHLDVESGLKTQIGAYLAAEIIARELAKPLADLKDQFGVDLDWRKIQSVTAYGIDYESRADDNGVLIVKSSQDIPAMLDQVMKKIEEAAGPGAGPLRKKKEGDATLYTLNRDAFGSPARGGVFVISKSRSKLTRAVDVIEGKAAHLGTAKTFDAFPPPASSFFFLGLADGFNNASGLPPQARVIKNSTGGQLVVGEKGGQVFADLALSTPDAEATAQIQQVFQGLLALATLNQDKNKDLARIAQATKVTTNETLVNVSLQLPATNIIAKVKEERAKLGK